MPTEMHRAERGHTFYPPPAQLATIPPLYATEQIPCEDKIVHLHYFTSGSDWWIAELDPDTDLAFGYARLNGNDTNAEWGYIDLAELEAVYRPVQVTNTGGRISVATQVIVERDLHWTPRPMREVLTQS